MCVFGAPFSSDACADARGGLQDIGCAIGSLITFFWGEDIGRKRMIMAGAATMLVGTVRLSLYAAPAFANLDYVGHPDQFHNTGATLCRSYRHWDCEGCPHCN